MTDEIHLEGASQHNLKNLDLRLPRNRIVAITGVSGSGKSSLAVDVLYAEGQRRYVESFSPYARQFLERADRPRLKRASGLGPAILIDRGGRYRSARATVGSVTEIDPLLRHLFALRAEVDCPDCAIPVRPWSIPAAVDHLLQQHPGRRCQVAFPYANPAGTDRGRAALERLGFHRLWSPTGPVELADAPPLEPETEWAVLVDRLTLQEEDRERLTDALELAERLGGGTWIVQVDREEPLRMSRGRTCGRCSREFPEPTAGLFSHSSPVGACPRCNGFGRVITLDLDRVVPDDRLPISRGAIKPWTARVARHERKELTVHCRRRGIPLDVPWRELAEEEQAFVIEGGPGYYGVRAWFDWLERKRRYKFHVRVFLSRHRKYVTCGQCEGRRLRPESLLYRVDGATVADLADLPSGVLRDRVEAWRGLGRLDAAPLADMRSRLDYLHRVGLGYLSLDRPVRTLSGGERQRVHLATALGTGLVGTVFVLDEPMSGLHPRDGEALGAILTELRDRPNTVIVTEHDPEIVRLADRIVDLGPGPGEQGGRIVYQGDGPGILDAPDSITGDHLAGRRGVEIPRERRAPEPGRMLHLTGVRHNNLRNLDLEIPLGLLTAVCGVSGSGKSSLVEEVLARALARRLGRPEEPPGEHRALEGAEDVADLVVVDQTPAARTPRSVPATAVKAFAGIRAALAASPEARRLGLKPGHFSFNSPLGRCPDCNGVGYQVVEMQYLADLTLRCPACSGSRLAPLSREVYYRGRTVAEILEATCQEALELFADRRDVVRRLRVLQDVGLGYLRLGQPVSTLSAGEAQRIKIAAALAGRSPPGTLFVLDEPSVGLHPEDIARLAVALRRLVDRRCSVLLVEHAPELLAAADWVIELGPGAGPDGGRIVVQGSPEKVARSRRSATAPYLRTILRGRARAMTVTRPPEPPEPDPWIRVRGAREHNLRDIDVDIPQGALTVVTGVSGSGKSSLAFDLLFAEGQRRYLDTLSAYTRMYLQQLPRPEVDSVTGLPPAVAIEQKVGRASPHSTVATVSEAAHSMRLLWARAGRQLCPDCSVPLGDTGGDDPATAAADGWLARGGRVTAPVVVGRKGFHRPVFEQLARRGIARAVVDGEDVATEPPPELNRYRTHDLDALLAEPGESWKREELIDRIRSVLDLSEGVVRLAGATFARRRMCSSCGQGFRPPEPPDLATTGPGACPTCSGLGRQREFDPEAILPDPTLSLDQGALIPLATGPIPRAEAGRLVRTMARKLGLPMNRPVEEWTPAELKLLLRGARRREGALDLLERIRSKQEGTVLGRHLEAFRRQVTCRACQGARLRPEGRALTLSGRSLPEVMALPVAEAAGFFQRLRLKGTAGAVAREVLRELRPRLGFLEEVGLGYLALDRPVRTLSAGEAQRVRLASQLGADLREVLYVLDEPTVGLHREDHRRLLSSLETLRDRGCTVVVVEHDEEAIRRADRVIDLGPGGGRFGGRVVCHGTPAEVQACPDSATGRALGRPLALPGRIPLNGADRLRLRSARANNLRGIDAEIPLGRLTCVTGVSGAGKSSLIFDCLEPFLTRLLAGGRPDPDLADSLEGAGPLARVLTVDSSPIGRTPRSVPATYVDVLTPIRKLFAASTEARARGFDASRFSFNSRGKCPDCKGHGRIKLEMSFLPDAQVDCPRCRGDRYEPEVLQVRIRERTIADVLRMTVDEASAFFEGVAAIASPLRLLQRIGLGYLALGQPSPTLSGGEAQRIKLAAEMGRRGRGHTLYLLDEPTTGLHQSDVARLLAVLRELTERGDTVVVIEHHLDVAAAADWVIDLGPGPGDKGGRMLFQGPPEKLAKRKSPTGKVLAEHLAWRKKAGRGTPKN